MECRVGSGKWVSISSIDKIPIHMITKLWSSYFVQLWMSDCNVELSVSLSISLEMANWRYESNEQNNECKNTRLYIPCWCTYKIFLFCFIYQYISLLYQFWAMSSCSVFKDRQRRGPRFPRHPLHSSQDQRKRTESGETSHYRSL